MAKYKVLRSVAHSLAHSFTSLMNYRDDNYVLSHLLRSVRETGLDSITIDLLSGATTPQGLLTPPVLTSICDYQNWLPRLLESHRTSMQFVQKAKLTLTFDLDRRRPAKFQPTFEETPYRCVVEITDDRGVTWSGEVEDWWYPESGELEPGEDRRISRLGQIIQVFRTK